MDYKEACIQQAMLMVDDYKTVIRATRNKVFYLLGFYFAAISVTSASILNGETIGAKASLFYLSIIALIISAWLGRYAIKPQAQRMKGIEPKVYSERLDYYKDDMFTVLVDTYQASIDQLKPVTRSVTTAYNRVLIVLILWFIASIGIVFFFASVI